MTPAAAAALAPVFARRPDVMVHVREPAEVEAITGFDFHRGCLALAWREPPRISFESLTGASRLLAIEGVGNPDNVGGLFRTAFALGVDAILLDRDTADPLYRKAIRTSMGATLRVPFLRVDAWTSDLRMLRSHGLRVLAMTPNPTATPVNEVQVAEGDRVIVLVGSEGAGLTDRALAQADLLVRIPIDPRADSLNVVVATGIALSRLNRL